MKQLAEMIEQEWSQLYPRLKNCIKKIIEPTYRPIVAHFCHHVDKYRYWNVFQGRFRPFLDSTGIRRNIKRPHDNVCGPANRFVADVKKRCMWNKEKRERLQTQSL